MSTGKFSFFKGGIKCTLPTRDMSIKGLHALIVSEKYKTKVLRYRETLDSKIKSSLDYSCPSGIFRTRSNKGLITHSGVLCIDVDGLEALSEAEALKTDLVLADIEPCLLYVSPSGKGIKALYFINTEVGTHREYFNAFQGYFQTVWGVSIDKACSDPARAAYVSYDTTAYLNDEAKELGTEFLSSYLVSDNRSTTGSTHSNKSATCSNEAEAIEILTKALEKTETFEPGNHNLFILNLASSYNRVGVSYESALDHLLSYAESDFSETEIRTTVKQSYKHTEWFGIAPLSNLSQTAEDAFAEVRIAGLVFPTEGLPSILLDFSKDIADVYGVPIELPIMSCLAAISSVLKKRVELWSGKYSNYGQVWVMAVAPSGVGKSEQMNIAFRPVKELDRQSYDLYKLSMSDWKNECSIAKKDKRIDPEKPFLKQSLISDVTVEALLQALSRNDEAVTLYRDELSGWIADFGRYGKSGEIAHYLSIFNNNQFIINRKGDDPLMVQNPFLSISGTIQPEVLDKALQENDLINNGFASRFLYVYPDTMVKQKYSESIPDEDLYNKYKDLVCGLADSGPFDSFDPFSLSSEAKTLFIAFSNSMTDKVNACNDPFLRASYSKMEIHCLRLALLIEVAKQESISLIEPETMQYAINLCFYFCSTVEKLGARQYKSREKKLDKLAVARFLVSDCDCSQNVAAKAVKLSQQYISKKLKK